MTSHSIELVILGDYSLICDKISEKCLQPLGDLGNSRRRTFTVAHKHQNLTAFIKTKFQFNLSFTNIIIMIVLSYKFF